MAWILPFWAATFAILIAAVLSGGFAGRLWGPIGLFAPFFSLWILLLVAIPTLSSSGPPATFEAVLGLGLFLAIVLAAVALPMHYRGMGGSLKQLLWTGLVAAAVSTFVSPAILILAATLWGDGL